MTETHSVHEQATSAIIRAREAVPPDPYAALRHFALPVHDSSSSASHPTPASKTFVNARTSLRAGRGDADGCRTQLNVAAANDEARPLWRARCRGRAPRDVVSRSKGGKNAISDRFLEVGCRRAMSEDSQLAGLADAAATMSED